MDPITAGAAIAAGSSLIGGLMGQDAQRSANAANREISAKNNKLQKEFAQMGIRWKVADAKAAGIHPVAALGASGASFSPSGSYVGAEDALASGVSNMGQDISRAIIAKQTAPEAALTKLQLANAQADLDGKVLDNQMRASQLQKLNAAPPPLPSPMGSTIPGQGNSGFKIKPSEVTASRSGVPAQEAGAINDYSFARTQSGYAIVPSQDVKNRIEDQLIPELMWSFRNQILPGVSGLPSPDTRQYPLPHDSLRRGAVQWKWNPLVQEFRPHTGKYFVD